MLKTTSKGKLYFKVHLTKPINYVVARFDITMQNQHTV